MNYFLILMLLFFSGSAMGWILEFFFRRFVSPEKKWLNPGFLTGPYLPIYGFGICTLFLLSNIEPYLPLYNTIYGKIILFIVMALAMTIIEYIAGMIFVVGLKTKLWDYSNERFNIKGIICLKYSIFWGLLGVFYYYVLHPIFSALIVWYRANLAFSFIIGVFFGVFVIDVVFSFNVIAKIRKFAVDNHILVRYEELKIHIRAAASSPRRFFRFVFTFHPGIPLKEHLTKYRDYLNSKIPGRQK